MVGFTVQAGGLRRPLVSLVGRPRMGFPTCEETVRGGNPVKLFITKNNLDLPRTFQVAVATDGARRRGGGINPLIHLVVDL